MNKKDKERFTTWVKNNYFQLAIFNLFVIILYFLRSAGYFHPYFIISVNVIVVVSLVVSVFLFRLPSEFLFGVAVFFWVFAGLIRLVGSEVIVWAERTGVYAYQALIIALLVFAREIFVRKQRKNIKER